MTAPSSVIETLVVQVVQQGIDDIRRDLAGLSGQMGQVNTSVTNLQQHMGGLKVSFQNLSNVLNVAQVALQAVQQAAQAGAGFLKLAGEAEQTQVAFTGLLKDGQKAKDFLAEMAQFAANTPFELEGLKQTSRQLLSFGFDAKAIIPILTAVGDAVGTMGGDPETMERVVRALGQMQAKGKVSAEEMMQIAETGLPVWKMLADQIGVSIPEAMKMAEKGAITSGQGIAAILQGMQKDFGGGMQKQSQTLLGMWSNTTDTLQQTATQLSTFLAEKLGAKEILGNLNEGLGKVKAMLDGGGIDSAFKRMGDALQSINPITSEVKNQLADTFNAMRNTVNTVLIPVFERIKPIVAAVWAEVPDIIRGAASAIQGAFQLIQAAWQNILKPVWDAIGPAVKDAVSLVGNLLSGALELIGGVFKSIAQLINGDWKGAWQTLKDSAVKALTGIGEAEWKLWDTLKGMAGRAWEKAKEIGTSLKNGILDGVKALQTELAEAIGRAMQGVLGYIPDWAQRLLNINGQAQSTMPASAKMNAPQSGYVSGTNYSSAALNTSMGERYAYDYISKLKDVFVNDPKVASDCAVIASGIMRNLGQGIRTSANAGVLEQNAIKAGYQKVQGDEIKEGDLIVWTSGNGKKYGAVSGKHVGVAAGYVNGKLMVINNPGSSNTVVEPMYDRQNAVAYRAPQSPFAQAQQLITQQPKVTSAAPFNFKTMIGGAGGNAPETAEDIRKKMDAQIKAILAKVDIGLLTKNAAAKLLQKIEDDATTTARKGGKGWEDFAATAKQADNAIESLTKKTKALSKDALGDLRREFDFMGKNGLPEYMRGLEALIAQQEKVASSAKKGSQEQKDAMNVVIAARNALKEAKNYKPDLTEEQRGQQRLNQERATNDMILKMRSKSEAQLQVIMNAPVSKMNSYERIRIAEEEVKRRQEVWRKDAENREKLLAQRKKDGERDIKETIELAQRQGEAEKSILLKYAEERRRLLDRAQSGTLTAEDVDAYKAKLASFVKEAGKAGVASSEVLKNAHASAMKFMDTAIDSNALAIANTASQYDGLSDAVSRGAARNATYQASLEDVLALLPGNADGWDDFVSLMAELDVKGNLAAGVMDGLRQKVQDLKDEMALEEGDRAAAIELANIAADPLAYADGAGRAGGSQAQAEARQRLADDLQQTLLGLDDATLQSADAMQVYEDMLTNAAQQGAITDKQLRELLDTLNLLKGGMEDFSQYADVTDGARGVKPSIGGLSPEQHLQNYEDFNATLLELADAELQSAVGMKALEDGLKGAAASGAITEQQLSDLLDTLKLLQQAASTGGEDFSQYEGITDGARGVKAAPGGDFEKQTAYAVELTAQLRQEFKGLAGDAEALAEKTAFWNDILSNAVKTGAITEGQMKALQAVMSGTVKAEELLAAAQKKVNEASGEFVGPNAKLIRSLEGLRDSAGVNQQQLEQLIASLGKLDQQAARQQGLDTLKSKIGDVGKVVGQVFAMFGADAEIQQGISQLTAGIQDGVEAFAKFASGDIIGGISAALSGIMNIGNAIENLDPGLKAWKKGLLEIAEIEKSMVGARSYGNISNPYYDALTQDAAARTQMGNSKWYQRLGWSLFGGAPQYMSDEAAKFMAESAKIFGQVAETVRSSLESAMMNAFDTGDWAGAAAAMEKSLNTLVAKMALQAIIASSNLEAKIKAYAEARNRALADGVIDPGEQGALDAMIAEIKGEMKRVQDEWQGVAQTLPGYGAGGQQAAPAGNTTASSQQAIQIQPSGLTASLNYDVLGTLSANVLKLAGSLTVLDRMPPMVEAFGGYVGGFGAQVDRLDRILTRTETDWGGLRK